MFFIAARKDTQVDDETNEYAEVNCLVLKDSDVTWQKYVVYRSSDKVAKYSKLV